MRQDNQGFGKRGRVEITPERELPQPPPPTDNSWMKYAAGGIAAFFLFGLIMGGTGGGGGLLGGLIGGLLGHHLGKKLGGPSVAGAPATSVPAATAAQPGSVQRGGFGSTGSSSGHSSFGS